jgi:hypothetical protein
MVKPISTCSVMPAAPAHRSAPSRIASGPVSDATRGIDPARALPEGFWTKSVGDNVDSSHFDPVRYEAGGGPSDSDVRRWKAKLTDAMAHQKAKGWLAFRKVHPDERSWLIQAKGTLCPFDSLQDAVIVCTSETERLRYVRLLDREKKNHFQDPMHLSTEKQVLAIGEINGRQFSEVFLSPGFGPAAPVDQLLLAVSAARVGLHLIKQAHQG